MLALTFHVGPERVAIDVRHVREVIPRVRLTSILGSAAWVAGVFIYRGQAVPVIDLHKLIGAGPCPDRLSSRICLVPHPASPDRLVGLLATQVVEVRDLGVALESSAGDSAAGIGPAIADGAAVIRILEPNRRLSGMNLDAAEIGPGQAEKSP